MKTDRLRQLLKKGVDFKCALEHDMAFEEVKRLLTPSYAVWFFNPGLPTTLLTNESSLNGLEYLLMQETKQCPCLVQALSLIHI